MGKFHFDTIIFDFDGVLADTALDIANAANYTLMSLGLPDLPPQVIMGYIGGGAQELLRCLLGEQADERLDQALPVFTQRYSEAYCVETELYPGVQPGLERLQRSGKRMAIATNKLEPLTRGTLEKKGIGQFFQFIVGPESVQHRKPHPEALLNIIDRLGANPQKTLMVGDTPADIYAGRAAGTLTCGVTYGYGKLPQILEASPDFVVDRFLDLLDCMDLDP